MIIALGFRNIFRNKKRTILAGLAVGLGLASLILADGFWKGMIDNMVSNITSTYIGHAQIHHPEFQKSYESEFYIKNTTKIEHSLNKMSGLLAYTKRTLSLGMISSSRDSINTQVIGIDPKTEKELSRFHNRIIQGKYVEKVSDLVIGVRLQKKLGVEIGDRMVLTLSQANTGEIQQELFRLTGVFGMGAKQFDEGIILVHQDKLQALLDISGFHEVAIKFSNIENVELNDSYLKSLNSTEVLVENWKELTPQIVATFEMTEYSVSIMGLILFTLVAFGILNTMFMSLFERKYEFGVLRAIGTKNREIVQLILAEAFALSVVSIFFGLIFSFIFGGWLSIYGVDYSGIQFGEITFTEKIYFIFTIFQFTVYPAILIVFTMLISLYPAWHVIRTKPAQALHRSL